MIDVVSLSVVAGAFFVAAASPGPATLAVATVSMSSGRRAGLIFGLGLSFGLSFWGMIAATGLGALLQTSAMALTILKLIGGAYLFWLAFKSARSAAQMTEISPQLKDEERSFVRGLLLNLSNPKAVFAWMAVLSFGLGEGYVTGHVVVATGLCSVLGLLIYTSFALVFSMPHAMSFYRQIRRWIDGAVATLFALAGIGLIRSAIIR